jgi:hypothetical protein
MRKIWIILLTLAVFHVEAQAQTRRNNRKEYEKQWICVGIKGGVGVSRMLYWHNEALRRLPQDMILHPTAGVFADIPLGKYLSIAPEAMYVIRGTSMSYQHYSGADVNYNMDLRYVDLRLPVELRWPIRPWLQPYVTLGGEVGVCLGDSIHMDRTATATNGNGALDLTFAVSRANMALIHGGAFAGLGIRCKIEIGGRDLLLKLAASYHQGLVDTYSAMEKKNLSTAANVNAYQVTGSRLPQGLELTLGVAVSLKSLGKDACATFSHDRNRRRGHGRSSGF